MKTQVFAKVLAIGPDNRVLVLKRSLSDDRRPGEWDFPGGTVEEGEHIEEGAARELYEESGIDVKPEELRLIYAATAGYKPQKHSNTRLLFAVRLSSEQVNNVTLSDEHDGFQWQPLAVAAAEHPHKVYKTGLQYAREHDLL